MTTTMLSAVPGQSLTSGTSFATATAAGQAVRFVPLHREGSADPVAVVATVTMPLSYADLVAALWRATDGIALSQIDPDSTSPCSVVGLVMQVVANDAAGIAESLCEIATIPPGTVAHEALRAVRALVATAFDLSPEDGDT